MKQITIKILTKDPNTARDVLFACTEFLMDREDVERVDVETTSFDPDFTAYPPIERIFYGFDNYPGHPL